MSFSFADLLFVTTMGVFADRLWSALLADLPSMDLQTNWIRALIFVGVFAMFAIPYLALRHLAPRLKQALQEYLWKRRHARAHIDYIV